jgi:hypothetical protein
MKISRQLYNKLVVWLDSQNLPGDAIIEIKEVNDRLIIVRVDSDRWDYHRETELNDN